MHYRSIKSLALNVALAVAIICPSAVRAEENVTVISLYRIAPGEHVNFMKFLSLKAQAKRAAGLTPASIYVHDEGSEWDFVVMDSAAGATEEQIKAYKDAEKTLGIPTGNKGWIFSRSFISSHEDLVVKGPVGADDWLKSVE